MHCRPSIITDPRRCSCRGDETSGTVAATMPMALASRGASQRRSHSRSSASVSISQLAQLDLDMADIGDNLDMIEEACSPDRIAMKQHALQTVLHAHRQSSKCDAAAPHKSLGSAAAASSAAHHDVTAAPLRVRTSSQAPTPAVGTPYRARTPDMGMLNRSRRASVTATEMAAESTNAVSAAMLAERRNGRLYSMDAQRRDENKSKTGMSVLFRW